MIRIEHVTGAVSYDDLADGINAVVKYGEKVLSVDIDTYQIGDFLHSYDRYRAVVVLETAPEQSESRYFGE